MNEKVQNTLDERVSYFGNPLYPIAEVLKQRGYLIASNTDFGIRGDKLDYGSLGILEPRAPIKKNFLGFRWNKKQRALFVGVLNAGDISEGRLKIYPKWFLEVYGRNNLQKLIELAREFPNPSNVKIEVRLGKEEPKEESYSHELARY